MLTTAFTELFAVEHPVLCRGPETAGSADLVAAAANAGAMSFLAVPAAVTPEELAHEITRCRELTDRPLGLDLASLHDRPQDHAAYHDVIVGSGIAAVMTGPALEVSALQEAGITVVRAVGTCRDTGDLLAADAVLVDAFGWPAAGDINGLNAPIIAGAGPADGRGLDAALALGAVAIIVTQPRGNADPVAAWAETIAHIVGEAEDIITGRLADLVRLPGSESTSTHPRAEPASETMLEAALESAWEAAP